MAKLTNYPKEFVERTIRLFDEMEETAKQNDLEVTFLSNCLLGLIVSIIEHLNKLEKTEYNKSLFNVKLQNEEIAHLIPERIKAISGKEIQKKIKQKFNNIEFLKFADKPKFSIQNIEIHYTINSNLRNNTLEWLIKKIRNGIAHQHIHPINRDGKWKGIRIWNINSDGFKDFAIEFKANELKLFSIEIANRFLLAINQE